MRGLSVLQGALSRHDTRLTNMEQWLTVSTLLRIVSRLWSIGVMSLLRAWPLSVHRGPAAGYKYRAGLRRMASCWQQRQVSPCLRLSSTTEWLSFQLFFQIQFIDRVLRAGVAQQRLDSQCKLFRKPQRSHRCVRRSGFWLGRRWW